MTWIGNTNSGATFSSCRQFRYTLWRRWVDECPLSRMCAFIGLNPSTADETQDDPTIRRCINFSKAWEFDGYVMLNLFAFRATDPKVMRKQISPIGEHNTQAIIEVSRECGRVVAAWGNHGAYLGRSAEVLQVLPVAVMHLGITGAGEPKHPLYLKATTEPQMLAKQGEARP